MSLVNYVSKKGLSKEVYEEMISDLSKSLVENLTVSKTFDMKLFIDCVIEEFIDDLIQQEREDMSSVCGGGDVEELKALMERKKYKLQPDPSAEYLREATREGRNEMAKFLIENGATIDYDEYVEEYPPIVYAVKYCSLEVIKMMVERGIDVHFYDDMIFGTDQTDDIWYGEGCYLEKTEPRPEVIEYLKTVKDSPIKNDINSKRRRR